jgi:hypothetical protein
MWALITSTKRRKISSWKTNKERLKKGADESLSSKNFRIIADIDIKRNVWNDGRK